MNKQNNNKNLPFNPPSKANSAYDILSRASGELSNLAADCGIDWQATEPRLTNSRTGIKCVPVDKKDKGKVMLWLKIKTAKNGQQFPIITYNHFKLGSRILFNGWTWLKKPENNFSPTATTAVKIAPNPIIENKRAEHANKEALNRQQTIKRFNDFSAVFELLPLIDDPANTYLAKKGFTAEQLTAINSGIEIKRGKDKDGWFIAFTVKNHRHKIIGYQKLYDNRVEWLNGDKQNIFLPNSKNGSFALIGNPKNQTDKLFICEGLATALSIHIASGKPCIIALDAGNLFHVAKTQSKAFKNITIAGDDDIAEHGNIGLYQALITAKEFNLDIAYPELKSGLKCDFNDLMIEHGLDEAKSQLKTNKLDFSESSVYYNLLLQYCPLQNKTALDKHFKSACFMAANQLILNNQDDIKNAAILIQSIIDNRKLELNAESQIKWFFDKKQFEIKKANSLVNLESLIIQKFEKDIAKKIRLAKLFNRKLKIENLKINPNDKHQIKKSGDIRLKVVKEIAKLKRELQQPYTDYISKNRNSIFLLDWCMGSGKTELMAYIASIAIKTAKAKGINRQVTYIAHRVALIKDAANRLDLRFYEDVQWYNGERPSTLAVCANSIVNHEVAEHVKILFIDEIRQVLEHILNGTCENRLEVFKELENAIKNADLVLCADADLNQFTVDWIKSIANKPIHLLQNESVKHHKLITELKSNSALFAQIRADLIAGKNAWISTDSMSKAKNITEFLSLEENSDIAKELNSLFNDNGLKLDIEKDILLITSENKADIRQAAFLENPNEESKKYRVIIHTPVISSGVSITNGHFENVYAIFCNVTAPNVMLQTIARVRTAKQIFCTFKSGHVKNRATNLKDVIDGEAIKRSRFSNGDIQGLNAFDKLRLASIVETNKALNDFKPYFFLLAQQNGYDVLPYKEESQNDIENKLSDCLKVISSVVKINTINSVLNAEIIDDKQAFKLDKEHALTQAKTDALKRYNVCQWTGKKSSEYTENDITAADVDFIEFNGGKKIIANYELLNADLEDLKKSDNDNLAFRDKLPSKTSKAMIFKTVIDGINELTDGLFDNKTAHGICEFLQDNCKELASNGLGNYSKVSRYPVRQLTEFLAKCGYDVPLVKKGDDGVRWYSIAPNEQVKGYADARAYQRKLKNSDADM